VRLFISAHESFRQRTFFPARKANQSTGMFFEFFDPRSSLFIILCAQFSAANQAAEILVAGR